MRKHVLMYHYCCSSKICPALKSFFESKRITFASVDKRRDRRVLARAHMLIPDEYHVDIQDVFKIKGTGPDDRDGMADLAAMIIDESYEDMKKNFTSADHDYWEWKPLSPLHLEYAARDGFVSYELFKRIVTMNEGLLKGNGQMCPCCRSFDVYPTGWI